MNRCHCQSVTQPCTNWAQRCLTSISRRNHHNTTPHNIHLLNSRVNSSRMKISLWRTTSWWAVRRKRCSLTTCTERSASSSWSSSASVADVASWRSAKLSGCWRGRHRWWYKQRCMQPWRENSIKVSMLGVEWQFKYWIVRLTPLVIPILLRLL